MKHMLVISIIILGLLLVVFLLFVGRFYISFHPFSIGFERPWNLMGWVCVILLGIFFMKDAVQVERKRYKENLDIVVKDYYKTLMRLNEKIDSLEEANYKHQVQLNKLKEKYGDQCHNKD